MHTDSSASFTYFASRSASEWTTTVRIPSSRHARWIRSAISPRLAIRIFSNIIHTVSQNSKGTPSPLTGEGWDGGENVASHGNPHPPPPPPPPPGGGKAFF